MCESTPHAREVGQSPSGAASAPPANGDSGPAVSECVAVRADVTVEELFTYFRMKGELPNGHVLFVLDRDHDFVGTLPLTRLASAPPSMLVRDLMTARRPCAERHLFEPEGEPSGNRSLPKNTPSTGSIWLAFALMAVTLALLVFVLVTPAKV